MSVEASCRKYLDAIAKQIATKYDFPWQYRKNPTIGDVLRAIDDHSWTHIKKRRTNTRQTPLDQLFSNAEWNELRELNGDTNDRIHDGRMRVTSSGRSVIVLPHSKFQQRRIARLQHIATASGLVSDAGAIVVKDEDTLSGSSSSSDSSQ